MRLIANLAYAVAALAVTLQAYLAVILAPMRTLYSDMTMPVPLVTRVAMSSAWRWGAPIAIAALIGFAMARRHTHPRMPIAVALIAITVLGATYLAATQPVFALAGSIQP